MAQVSMNLLGYAQANAQLTAEAWDPATNLKIASTSVLADGSALFTNIPTGAYQVRVRYANLLNDVAVQTIYVQPAGETRVSMYIDPKKFTNVGLVDVPDADLEPLATMAQSVELAAGSYTNKMPGEILTAAWANGVALAIRNLAHAVTLLARSVTPKGHNHVEYENKLTELSTNFEKLVQTLAESTVTMQRRFEIQKLQSRVEAVFTAVNLPLDKQAIVLDAITATEANINESPKLYSERMRSAALAIHAVLKAPIEALPGNASDVTKRIVADYKAVLAVWTARSVKDLFGELNQTKIDLNNIPSSEFKVVDGFNLGFQ
jgi:hypothetical protein